MPTKVRGGMVGDGIREFLYDVDGSTFLKGEQVGFVVDRNERGGQRSQLHLWTTTHSCISRASDQFHQCKKHSLLFVYWS